MTRQPNSRWRGRRVCFAAALLAQLAGCATTREWYVVMPSADGHPGTVVVARGDRETVLHGPYSSTRSGAAGAFTVNAEEVQRAFDAALRATPPRPVSFTVFFDSGQDEFTRHSRIDFDAITREIARRPAPQITVIGHADATGSHDYNDALSLRRAQRIRAELIRLGLTSRQITIEGRGKREPQVLTADNQSEPRNRRVEIEIR